MQSISSALEAKWRFKARSPEDTKYLLLTRGVKDNLLVSVLKEWKELAKAYGIESEKLRPDDYIADLVETDWFGDRGLMIEARLTRCGIKELPRDMTIAVLYRLWNYQIYYLKLLKMCYNLAKNP